MPALNGPMEFAPADLRAMQLRLGETPLSLHHFPYAIRTFLTQLSLHNFPYTTFLTQLSLRNPYIAYTLVLTESS